MPRNWEIIGEDRRGRGRFDENMDRKARIGQFSTKKAVPDTGYNRHKTLFCI